MALEIGSVLEGKVTGITKFGAFVALPDGKSGLVHISEIANTFVSDVSAFVELGQTVRVRVLSISGEGKINLSMKRAEENAQEERFRSAPPRRPPVTPQQQRTPMPAADGPSGDPAFEERLKKFMQDSDSRMADRRQYFEHRTRRGRR